MPPVYSLAEDNQRWADKQAAREARLREKAQDCRSYATKSYPWGQFVSVVSHSDGGRPSESWMANLFFKTKAAAEYDAKHISGFKVYAIAKVTGL